MTKTPTKAAAKPAAPAQPAQVAAPIPTPPAPATPAAPEPFTPPAAGSAEEFAAIFGLKRGGQ